MEELRWVLGIWKDYGGGVGCWVEGEGGYVGFVGVVGCGSGGCRRS